MFGRETRRTHPQIHLPGGITAAYSITEQLSRYYRANTAAIPKLLFFFAYTFCMDLICLEDCNHMRTRFLRKKHFSSK